MIGEQAERERIANKKKCEFWDDEQKACCRQPLRNCTCLLMARGYLKMMHEQVTAKTRRTMP